MEATRRGRFLNYPFQFLFYFLKLTLYALVLAAAFYGFNRLSFSDAFPIKQVRVAGVKRLDRQEVKNLLLPLVSHGFFAIRIDAIRDRLVQLPWVADISVARAWPDQVNITIIEKEAVAKWGDQALLSTAGDVFSPRVETYPQGLPMLNAPLGKQIITLEYFAKINRLLLPLHAKISSLTLSPYATWTLQLDNGITLQLGHKDVLARLDEFVRVYPKIVGQRAGDVEYVDLRYPNGFAVKWKQGVSLK